MSEFRFSHFFQEWETKACYTQVLLCFPSNAGEHSHKALSNACRYHVFMLYLGSTKHIVLDCHHLRRPTQDVWISGTFLILFSYSKTHKLQTTATIFSHSWLVSLALIKIGITSLHTKRFICFKCG